MNSAFVPVRLRREVIRRSQQRCEYCLLSVNDSFFKHEPDHIVAKKHGGKTSLDNLALACFDCNRSKGSDIASIDPSTGKLVPLFNPRTDDWQKHFAIEGGTVTPQSSIGRATTRLLKFNTPERMEVRETLARIGQYPG